MPDRIVAKLRIEKAGRGGKTVTVVYGLPRNVLFLKDLCKELKRTAGRAAPSRKTRSNCREITASASATFC